MLHSGPLSSRSPLNTKLNGSRNAVRAMRTAFRLIATGLASAIGAAANDATATGGVIADRLAK